MKNKENIQHILQLQEALEANAIVTRTDMNGKILEANDNFCLISGYSRDELIGQDHRLVNSKAHSKEFFKTMWETISSGQVWKGLIENKKKSQESYFVQTVITPIFDENKKIQSYLAIRFDATNQVLSERLNEKLLNRIQEAEVIANLGFWEADLKSKLDFQSDGLLRLLKLNHAGEDATAEVNLIQSIYTDDQECIHNEIKSFIEKKIPKFELEYRVQPEYSNKLSWHKLYGRLECDEFGEVVKVFGAIQDITKDKLAQLTIQSTLDILNETGSMAKIGGWEVDIATGILHWTDETFKILEVEKREGQYPVLEQGLSLFTPEYVPVVDLAVQRAIQLGEPFNIEVEALTAKGNKVWVQSCGKANRVDGVIKTISGTFQDISERRKKDMELQETHLKLIQNSKLASLGEMSAGIAHEINNPLMIISGSIGLLSKIKDNKEKFDAKLVVIQKSCERINRIVNGLRKFSRISQAEKFKSLTLDSIAKEVLTLVEAKSKTFETPITYASETNALINCDEVEIEQVLVNLINNAIDANKENPEKWVRVLIFEKDEFVIVHIIDSGKGIPKEVREKLFDPFFTTKDIGEGTGLGLSITKGILDSHNATISVIVDCPNTCFQLCFPKVI